AGRSLQDMGWQATSMTFTANAPSTALNFASASPNDSVGPALDNVRTTLIGFGAIEDTVLSSSVRAVDPDGDALTYSLVSGTTHGSLTLNANGSFTYTPDANYNGADSFQVKASDGAASAVQTFSIGVAAANDAPTIVPSGATFDGSAHVGIAGPAIFTGAGGYSYEVTFKTSSTGIYQTLLSVGVFTTNKASEFVIGPDGKLNFGVNNAHVSVITSAGSVADGQWHTATATYNGSGQLALYLDGALVGTSSYAGVSLTGGVAMIGAANTDIRNHFVGEIAEAHVWNRGLSAAEATNQSTPSPTDAGLIGSYLFSSGTTANAASGLPDGANVGVTFSVSGGVREIAEGAAGEGSAISSTSGAILFKDVDAGDSHGATFTPNGAGYLGSFSLAVDQALDRANWQFTVADAAIEHLAAGQVLAQSYTVTVTDAAGAPVSQVVTVTIAGTNDAPVVANAIPDRSVNEDTSWTYTIAGNAFSDVDSASLTYAARSLGGGALPAWLSFDAATRTFSGTPPTNFNGTVALQVTASDGSLSVTDAFNLNVAPVNDAPVLANAIPDRTVNEDSAWSYTMEANSFTDVDNPTLTYAASLSGGGALPSWLGFNAATRTFTGTPPANFNGTVGLTVTASDGSFSVSDGFILSVLPVADMPTLSVGSSTVLQPTVGAAAAYTASLTAGQAFTFNWNFVAGDYLPYNDFAFVSVNGVVTSLALVEVVGDYGGTGWRTYSFTAPTTGSYTIGIGVANDRDTSFISDLLVDNVRIGGVSVASFESSISPFAISGTVTRASAFSTTNAPVVQSPTDGAFMLRINGTPTSAAALETFVGAPAGSLALAATPTGHAGKPIAVPVNVTTPPGDLQDTYILIKGMPAGATFSLGSYDAALGGWKVDASALGGNLTMTTSVTGNHTLTITATSFASETNTTQTTAAKSVSITVLAGTGSDPLVFDLGGDGVSFLTADAGVTFDLDGDGTAEATGWLTAGDGLLVLDLDGSGAIEDGTEVLSETFLGLDFANSLDALRFLDDNEDGVIDAGDEAYSTLRLWADADGDGVSDAGELHGFAEMGIVSIDLSATELDATQDRQDLLGSAAFSFEDGSVGTYYVVQLNQPALVPAGEFLG
ncbi:MAG: large repetitive protein, partial [Sphingomonadales bacterium]|nr:large repetitive protein [Sphingomonadales bacterium]